MSYQKEISSNPVTIVSDPSDPVFVEQPSYPIVPKNTLLLRTEFLENGGAPDMNVDGSVTPVTFSWSPPAGIGDVLLERFQIVLVHTNITDYNSFGNLPGLTNGIKVIPNFNGTPFTFVTIKRNIEFTQFSTTTQNVFNQQSDINQGSIQFDIQFYWPQAFNNSNLILSVEVADDLTNLDYLRANVFFSEVVP